MKKYTGSTLPLLIVIALTLFLHACQGHYPYTMPIDDKPGIDEIASGSSSVAEFLQKLADGKYYSANIKTVKSTTTVKAEENAAQLGQIRGATARYCTSKDGGMQKKYIPKGHSPLITEGFTKQAVFYHQTGLGRTELEWCMKGGAPLYGIAYTGEKNKSANGLYIIEGSDMTAYIKKQSAYVASAAESGSKLPVRYQLAEVNKSLEDIEIWPFQLSFTGIRPELRAAIKNVTNEAHSVETGLPLGLLHNDEQWLLYPIQAGDKIAANLKGEGCSWDKHKMILTIDAGVSCQVQIMYNTDDTIDKMPLDNITIFFVGGMLRANAVSYSGTNNSDIWLKPILDMQGRK